MSDPSPLREPLPQEPVGESAAGSSAGAALDGAEAGEPADGDRMFGTAPGSPDAAEVRQFTSLPPMRYQTAYVWFVLFSSLDVVLTWHILERHGGSELNPVAALLIAHWGFMGAVGLKYGLLLMVVIACEWVARRRERTGRRLAWLAVAVSLVPPIWSFALLATHAAQGTIRLW